MVEQEYAKAVYELAIEEKKVDSFSEAFNIVSETIKDEEFLAVLTSPIIPKDKKKEIIKNVYKAFDSTFIDFLFVLLDHNRFDCLNAIAEEYTALVRKNKNIVRVSVYSVKKLSVAEIKNVNASLKPRYNNKELEIENIVDPKLLGGIKVICNGESVDVSLKRNLDTLKESL